MGMRSSTYGGIGARTLLCALALSCALASSGCYDQASDPFSTPRDEASSTKVTHEIQGALKVPGAWDRIGTDADTVSYLTEAGGIFRLRRIDAGGAFAPDDSDDYALSLMEDAAREMGVPFSFDSVEKWSSPRALAYKAGSFRGRRGYGMILLALSDEGCYLGYQVESGEVTWEAQQEAESSFEAMAEDLCGEDDLTVDKAYNLEAARTQDETAETLDTAAFSVTTSPITREGERVTLSGTVTNETDAVVYYLRVRCDFLDEAGRVRDWNMGFATTSQGLAPGETAPFSVSVADDRIIADGRASITKYRETSYVRK